jgi:TPP-dependent pyruvate/acetoin dehydrogenase alpha subunit
LRKENILTDEIMQQIQARVETKLNEAIQFALASPIPGPLDGIDEVFSQPV